MLLSSIDGNPVAGITSLPHDLLGDFFSKYMQFINDEDELDQWIFACPAMLLVLQFVNKTFNKYIMKEGSLSRTAILAHRMRNPSFRSVAASATMKKAARQFGSRSLLRWLEKLNYSSFSKDYFTGAIEGGIFDLIIHVFLFFLIWSFLYRQSHCACRCAPF